MRHGFICFRLATIFSFCTTLTLGKEGSFPPQILASKAIAVVSHYGFVPPAFNATKGDKFKREAEDVLRESKRFQLVDDPDRADLVLLLVGGYSPGWLGFRDSIVIGAVFLGGAHQQWSAVPLWILEQSPTLRTSSAPKALAKEFLKQVAKAESRGAASPDGNEPEKIRQETKSGGEQRESSSGLDDEQNHWLRPEILSAKKVMVLLRIDEVAAPQGEVTEKNVEKELRKWGRFTTVTNPSDADLLFVCVRYLDTSKQYPPVYENLLIFKGGTSSRDWSSMPLWNAMQIDAPLSASPGTQMVRWLRKQIEKQEARPVPPNPKGF